MNNEVTGAVKADWFTGSLRSLDAENPQANIVERIDEMLVQMAAAQGGGGAAIRSHDGIPINNPNIMEELWDKFTSFRLESTPPRERRLLIEDMLKLLDEDKG